MQGQELLLVGPWRRGRQRGGRQDNNDDGRRHNNMTINLPAKDERRQLTRVGGNKRKCRLMTGGRCNVRRRLSMGGCVSKSSNSTLTLYFSVHIRLYTGSYNTQIFPQFCRSTEPRINLDFCFVLFLQYTCCAWAGEHLHLQITLIFVRIIISFWVYGCICHHKNVVHTMRTAESK